MRHGKKFNHLGRKAGHRRALLMNMACSLIKYKRINTTLAKAKALRQYIEPLVTKGKNDTTHNRRVVFSYLQNKEAIDELFGPVAEKVGDRPGGYVRVIRTGFRKGDGAETAMIELVDFNEVYEVSSESETGGGRRRRRRRGGGSQTTAAAEPQTQVEETEEMEETEDLAAEAETEEAVTEETAQEETSGEEEENEEEKKEE